ncbi:chalcone isomerase family protein [Pseudomonas sp. BIC9C]|uniref:chalcone isomerase family protein n=1 Tax=Pseudomonas sp. BIC9C TaxID=3078458 RepID=UPI002AD398F8|nr:chalcone isomerase family protein [Pseudomonas sp. BIC9C]
MNRQRSLLRHGLWLLVLLSCQALANWQDSLPGAQILGTGEFRKYGFDVYSARLWSTSRPLANDQPFALELIYQRSISRDDLVNASVREIKRLSGTAISDEQLASWQAQMQQSFVDVQAGTRLTGVYLPGQGARFFLGQHLLREVKDLQFAQAFFAIWLDPRTSNPELRQQLLGAAP